MVSIDALIGPPELWQYDVADLFADQMSVVRVDLDAGRVIAHLTHFSVTDEVETLDYLESGFPVPYVGAEFVSLRTHVMQCETHINPLKKC